MPDPNGLDVHDIVIANSPTFDRAGRMVNNTVVTFGIGDHGPFTLVYGPGEATPDRVNADIAAHVRDIRAVVVRPT